MRVEFGKAPGGGSVALIDRPDGVRLRLRSYDRKSGVPHDIAHLVTERTFRLDAGLWGSIAVGAVFASMEELSGRRRHDRRERSKAVLRANADDLGLAEVLVGVVHRGLDHGHTVGRDLRAAWGALRTGRCPYTESDLVAAVAELRAVGDRWAALPAAATLPMTWPVHAARRTRTGR